MVAKPHNILMIAVKDGPNAFTQTPCVLDVTGYGRLDNTVSTGIKRKEIGTKPVDLVCEFVQTVDLLM
jgi:hypothetical protein